MGTKVAVIGAGSWGTTVAAIVAARTETVLWARRSTLAAEINERRLNSTYLPDARLPESLVATSSITEAVDGASVVVMGVPSHGFRAVLSEAAEAIVGGTPVLSLSKGLEQQTLLRMTEVIGEICPASPAGVLTGPNLAAEVVAGQPTATVVAFTDENLALELQDLFWTESLRVYTNTDVVGCEIAGAVKNVMAIATGMAVGLGFGDNTRAAVITRSLAEVARLGTALGGDPLTFGGLAGLGDLVATCTSAKSRNFSVGLELASGKSMDEIVDGMKMVAEGIKSSRPVVELADRHGLEMPIAEQVVAVLYEGKPPAATIPSLMSRSAKPELEGLDGRESRRG
jgi:glycerol-3-phosphate dehydrogenase (NAD(P)+)